MTTILGSYYSFDSVKSLLLNSFKMSYNLNQEIIFSQWNFLSLEFFLVPHGDDIA